LTEWFEVYRWPVPPKLEVAHGPKLGDWALAVCTRPGDVEAVLARWRREYPGQVVALIRAGQVIEGELAKAARLVRERWEREAAYFERLAAEAHGEGRPDGEARYLRLAVGFRRSNVGGP
jgi:uncharacterized iron-regulated membrane protein